MKRVCFSSSISDMVQPESCIHPITFLNVSSGVLSSGSFLKMAFSSSSEAVSSSIFWSIFSRRISEKMSATSGSDLKQAFIISPRSQSDSSIAISFLNCSFCSLLNSSNLFSITVSFLVDSEAFRLCSRVYG